MTSKIIVPNVAAIAREMTGSSQIVLVVKRFLALGLKKMFVFGWNNLLFLPLLARMDYAVGVKILCELEILKSKKRRNIVCALHNQMVDMAIALNNKKVVVFFFGLAKKYNFSPGLISYNPKRLVAYLSSLPYLPNNLVLYLPKGKGPVFDYLKLSGIKVEEINEN